MKSDLIDIEGIEVHRTPKAILVRFDDDKEPVWLPLSAVEVEPLRVRGGQKAVTVTMPQRLAEEKELV